MKSLLSPLFLILLGTTLSCRADSFVVYGLASKSDAIIEIPAIPSADGDLKFGTKISHPLPFRGTSICTHPDSTHIYIVGSKKKSKIHKKATVVLDSSASIDSIISDDTPSTSGHITVDRSGGYVLGSNFSTGIVQVIKINADKSLGPQTQSINIGKKFAHYIDTSTKNNFAYVPYVKKENALHQYAFDETTGKLEPLSPLDASPPEGTGPRHLSIHPSGDFLYSSNEQHLGASSFRIAPSGQLSLLGVTKAEVAPAKPTPSIKLSSSFMVGTSDGKYLFSGIRNPDEANLDRIITYKIDSNGIAVKANEVAFPAKIPRVARISSDDKFLLVTSQKSNSLVAFSINPENGSLSEKAHINQKGGLQNFVLIPLPTKE